jgi:secreted PhoX family phosphatase
MSIVKPEYSLGVSRRHFLRGAVTASVGAVAVAVAPVSVAKPMADEKPNSTTKKGYRLTSHIAQYYKTAAF